MSNAEVACLIPVQGTKIPRAMGAWPRNERNKKAFLETAMLIHVRIVCAFSQAKAELRVELL